MPNLLRSTATVGAIALLTMSFAACGSISDVASPSASSGTVGDTAPFDWASSTFETAPTAVNGEEVSIDVGEDRTVTQNSTDPLRIAFAVQGTTNSYAQAAIAGAQAHAEEIGAELTVFDGDFTAQTQFSQIQNILNSGDYDAILGLIVDGNSACQILTNQAPDEDVLVAIIIQPTCGRDVEAGIDLWSPGTLTTVAGGGSLEFYQAWAEDVASSVDEPTEAVYITGPEGLSPVVAATAALRDASAKYPDFQLVDVQYTDYSSAQALAATQNSLIAHSDVTMFLSHFTPLTVGIQQALAQAGKQDGVKVFDLGGDTVAKQMVVDDDIEQTVPYFPGTAGACAVDMLAAAHAGKAVPRVVLNDCRATEGGNGVQTNVVIDKSNVDTFVPEY